jgi:hypothetical protein
MLNLPTIFPKPILNLMPYDLFSVLAACGVCCVALWLVGFPTLLIAVKRARREFRAKGYLKVPSGVDWFSFLLTRRYEAFDDSAARSCFKVCHFCMLGCVVVMSAVVVLIGCVFLLRLVSEGP